MLHSHIADAHSYEVRATSRRPHNIQTLALNPSSLHQSRIGGSTGRDTPQNLRLRLLHHRSTLLCRHSTLLHRYATLLHRYAILLHRHSTLLHRHSTLMHHPHTARFPFTGNDAQDKSVHHCTVLEFLQSCTGRGTNQQHAYHQ